MNRNVCYTLSLLSACAPPKAHPVPDTGQPPADTGPPPADTSGPDPLPGGPLALEDAPLDCDLEALDKVHALERIIDGLSSPCEIAWYISVLDALDSTGHEGPWLEQMWVMESDDARTFDVAASTAIPAYGAVPEAVVGPDGRTYLYYVDGDLEMGREVARSRSTWFRDHGLMGYGSLNAMVSDDGISFEPLPDFAVRGAVRGMLADPDVIALPDGRYRMYYVGMPAADLGESGVLDEHVPFQAFYAESADLITWGQVGVAAEGPNADPTVTCDAAGACWMASSGVDWGSSTDGGASFSFGAVGDPDGFAPEFVRLEDGRLRLLYNSKDLGSSVNSWISEDDGATWTEEGEAISICLAEALSLVPRPGGGWRVYYHYWRDGLSGSDIGDHAGETGYPDPCDEVEDPRG